MQVLDHERLEVYQAARELSREVGRVMKKVRNRHERLDLVDQVFRALASIVLNIAEGAGEFSIGRKAYFYRIASGSSTELSAALDHLTDMGMLAEEDIVAAKTLLVRIVSMLFKLTRSVNTPDSFPPLRKRSTVKPYRSRKRER